jgi:hypothetical protein
MANQQGRETLYFRRMERANLPPGFTETSYVSRILLGPLEANPLQRQAFQEYADIAGRSLIHTEDNLVVIQTNCDPDYITHAMKLIGYERVIRG